MSKDKVLQATLDKIVALTKQRDDLLAALKELVGQLEAWYLAGDPTANGPNLMKAKSAIAAGG